VKATGSAPRPPTHSNLSLDGSSAKFASDLTNSIHVRTLLRARHVRHVRPLLRPTLLLPTLDLVLEHARRSPAS